MCDRFPNFYNGNDCRVLVSDNVIVLRTLRYLNDSDAMQAYLTLVQEHMVPLDEVILSIQQWSPFELTVNLKGQNIAKARFDRLRHMLDKCHEVCGRSPVEKGYAYLEHNYWTGKVKEKE
jgi:hypothetical protein